jgi:hypothetical protein
MPIFGSKDKSGNLACNFAHVQGIDGYGNAAVCITQDDSNERLSVAMRLSKVPPKLLPYRQITSVGIASEKEIIEQSKSVIGRAAVGGLLLGPLGAVIGGLSGTGSKTKTNTRHFFVINYHPSNDPEEIKVISFEIVGASLHWDKFLNSLKNKIPKQPVQSQYL